ncbi:MAG TPA: magnesium transporter, partial [Acholeplasmataceae bacterium]|nr:magnesium transporter [Acholeplasmataceae bacterium]
KTQVLDLLENKAYVTLRKLLDDLNEADIAEILEELDENKLLITFRLLQKDKAVNVFSHVSAHTQEKIVNSATDKELKFILEELFFDDMIDLLEEMPANIVKRILLNVKENDRALVNQFLNYPDNTAGSLMTIEFVDFKRHYTVKDALNDIRRTGVDKETIYTCYIIDENRKLEGIVSLRELVINNEDIKVEDIMTKDVIYVHTHDDQEEIANKFKKYDLIAMPVVDNENRLVGIITVDDIIDVIEEETTEDIYKMAAMTPTEDEYLETSTFQLAKNRLSWLIFLMISATLTGYIIKSFEDILATTVVLTIFIPLLMDTGGNAGSQSATVVIRGLALGHIKIKDYYKVIFKEFRVSLIVGILLSIFNFARIMIFENVGLTISLIVSMTLFITIMLSKVIGGILPIIASKLKLDPAIMASPLITTIVDALSLSIYFILASSILGV